MSRLLKLLKNHPYEFLTAVAILAFILFKIPDIRIPFHWDEMGVYIPAAFRMTDNHHISLLPGSIDPLYSRGHPLLFTFCNALVFKVFGESVTTGHIFALILAVATLVMLFFVAKRLFNPKVAFFSTALLLIQPIFFSMSVQVLPEMMLTFFTLGSMYAILEKKWGLYALFGSLAMLTKESAIVIPGTALALLFIASIRDRDFFTLKRFGLFLTGAVPLFVFAIFLVVQKIQNGWFLFPEHVGYIHTEFIKLYNGAQHIFNDLFIRQGRALLGYFFLAGLIIFLFPEKLKIDQKGKILWSFALLIFLALIFADLNYYLTRYILYFVPFVVMGGTYTAIVVFEKVFSEMKATQWLFVVLFFCYAAFLGHTNMYGSPTTCEMSYKLTVDVNLKAIRWAEQNWKNDTLAANFPVDFAVEDPRNGYLTGGPLHFTRDLDKPCRYGLLYYTWEDKNIPIGSSRKFHIIKKFDEEWEHVAAIEFDRAGSGK